MTTLTYNNETTKEKASSASIPAAPSSDRDVASTIMILETATVAPWARYIPGPSPAYRYPLSKAISRIGVVACGCMIFLLSGYNVALMGGVSSLPLYLETVGLTDTSYNTELLIGTINAMYWVGVIIGALGIGVLSDAVGRRRALVLCLIYAAIVIPIFTALQSFAWALILRFLNGVAVGAIDSVGLNWTAETADHKRRGLAIGLELVFAPSAASIAFFMVYSLPQHSTSALVWRFPLAFQLIFVIMISSTVCFLPESPRWLVKAGLLTEARDVLIALKPGTDEEEIASAVDHDLTQIVEALRNEKLHDASVSYWRMFTAKDSLHTRRRSWSALFVQGSTQIAVGVGLVSAYGILLFRIGGFDSNLAALLTGGAILTQAVFGIPGAFLADRMGRRIAMWGGAFLSSVILLLIGVCGYFVDKHAATDTALAKTYGIVIITLVYLYCAVFGLTWLWVPFTYPSEIFPARSRSRGSSIGIAGFAMSSFLVNMIGPIMFSGIGYCSLFLICGLALITSLGCFFFMPETAGKTLEEIDSLFD